MRDEMYILNNNNDKHRKQLQFYKPLKSDDPGQNIGFRNQIRHTLVLKCVLEFLPRHILIEKLITNLSFFSITSLCVSKKAQILSFFHHTFLLLASVFDLYKNSRAAMTNANVSPPSNM